MGNLFGGGAKQTMMATMVAQQNAEKQAQANKEAAIAGTEMSMVDQYTPDGSLVFKQIGTTDSGSPRWAATTTLDPTQQAAYDAQKQVDLKTNTLAGQQLDRATGPLSENADLSDAAIKAKTDQIVNPRLDKRYADEEASLKQSLIIRGLSEGTQAFNDAMLSFNQGKTDAYSTEALGNRQQAIQELLLPRNQIYNEIAALMGTGQIESPKFVSTPQANVQAPDYGQVTQAFTQANAAAQQKKAAAAGGLFGLIGSGLQAAGSAYGAKK